MTMTEDDAEWRGLFWWLRSRRIKAWSSCKFHQILSCRSRSIPAEKVIGINLDEFQVY